MKRYIFAVSALIWAVSSLTGCQSDSESSGLVSGKIISHSECKSKKSTGYNIDIPDSLSCIDYIYEKSTGLLKLTHVNAGFNCCPDSIYSTVTASADSIIIEEFEKFALCNCNCLFDLYFELTGIQPKLYHFRFIEPYAMDQEPLIFDLDLANEPSGSFCVVRKHYPWGSSIIY